MKISQLFFSRSNSNGGLPYSTVTSKESCLLSHVDILVAKAACEEDDKWSAVRVALGWCEEEDLAALERSSHSMRRRSSYTSRVRLRIRANR